jgi:hypothetical protein
MVVQTSEKPNILIITIDSCRWDTFSKAHTPAVDSFCTIRKAYAQATFTYAAHLAIYQGHLPSTRERINYYNRFTKPLFRIANNQVNIDSFAGFPQGTRSIVHGFRNIGYYAIGFGATGWFRHPDLTLPFDEFTLTGINAELQIAQFTARMSKLESPFFGMLNFGETHEPYEHGGQIPHSYVSRARSSLRACMEEQYDAESWLKQVRSCEFLDSKIGDLTTQLSHLSRGTIVVLCADHGECFGEDGLFGHGFYHPKVMEVPLGIFEINCGLL